MGSGLFPTRPGNRVSHRLATSESDQGAGTTSGRLRRITWRWFDNTANAAISTPKSPASDSSRSRIQVLRCSVRTTRESIDPAEKGSAHHALDAVINPDFIRDHDLRAIPSCHARMLPIGPRCPGPVGHRPAHPHEGESYRSPESFVQYLTRSMGGPECPSCILKAS